jgi:hypothetical protein
MKILNSNELLRVQEEFAMPDSSTHPIWSAQKYPRLKRAVDLSGNLTNMNGHCAGWVTGHGHLPNTSISFHDTHDGL